MHSAAAQLRGVAVHTPLVPLNDPGGRRDILLKPEILQPITSFKIRGVFNAVASLTPEGRARGLSTVSAGNTAQALAWCGRHFGVPARSIMPQTAPRTKVRVVESLGGQPLLVPTPEVFRFLREQLWQDEPYAFIHPWTNRNVLIGHASLGLEIAADLAEVAAVYVPVGGGGLIAGVGAAMRALCPRARVIAVEPEGCPALHASFRQGSPAAVECKTLCDGVAVPYITDEMFPLLRELVDDVLLVTEDEVRQTIRRLATSQRMIVEGSAALPVAAALASHQAAQGPAVCVVTGGSIDTDVLLEILGESA